MTNYSSDKQLEFDRKLWWDFYLNALMHFHRQIKTKFVIELAEQYETRIATILSANFSRSIEWQLEEEDDN